MEQFRKILKNKKQFLPLLLLADEQEDMIDRYLDRGALYVLEEDGLKALCVVTEEGSGVLEIKNLAVDPGFHRRGYGRRMVRFLEETYRGRFTILRVGTGDSPLTLPFYRHCGFREAFRIPNFFTDHYDHPIFEGGKQLVDMVCLEKSLNP